MRLLPATGTSGKTCLEGCAGTWLELQDESAGEATLPYDHSVALNGVNRVAEAVVSIVAGGMAAMSSAQVNFTPPRDRSANVINTRRELGRPRFSPYWQVRLIDTPCTVRQAVAVSYGTGAPCVK